MITLYTTHCPKCKVLEIKLSQKGISYTSVDDPKEVVAFGEKHKITGAPILDIDGKALPFADAVKWVNGIEK